MSTIAPLATAASLATQRACYVHVFASASHATHLVGGAAFAGVALVVAFVVTLTRAVRRVAALVGAFLQLAAAMTSMIITLVIVAALAAVVLIH